MDIARAVELEKAYLEHRMKGEEPFHMIDAIKECGFETLEEYFAVKQDYLFGQLQFRYVDKPMPGGVAEIFEVIKSNAPGALFVDWERTYVVCANAGLEEFNREYCIENKIPFFPLYTDGGTIVGAKGDFSLGICCPQFAVNDYHYILNGVKNILQRHTEKEVTVRGNDICVDGNKICGSASYRSGKVLMVIMHFTFTDLSDLISKICRTTKTGKPVTYIDFITRDTFKTEVAEWLRV